MYVYWGARPPNKIIGGPVTPWPPSAAYDPTFNISFPPFTLFTIDI